MTQVRLSGAIIAQDNEDTIGLVLDNLARVADEIIVVDGGSRDATPEIAAAREKVRVYRRAFDGDFAAQKNFALDQALGDWILMLDTDELLGARALEGIPRWIRGRIYSWYKFPTIWVVDHEGGYKRLDSKLHYPDHRLRLFRNRAPFRYRLVRGGIHEGFPKPGRGLGRKLRNEHLFHYSLLLSDEEQLREKAGFYESRDPSSASTNRMYFWKDDTGMALVPLDEPLPGEMGRKPTQA